MPWHQVDMKGVPLLVIVLIVILNLLFFETEACGPGRGPHRRRLHRKDVPLVFKQHVPNVSENSAQASSAQEGRISRTDPRFRDLVPNYNNDIIFQDEEGSGEDRLMTQRCNEKLNTLAISVMNQWPGVKLRVTEGWDEDGHHSAGSLHYEGRAVDITTSDRDRSKYGMLARLAVEAGFDWVYYESRGHIHCSVKSESSHAANHGGCFTANSTVLTSTGEKRRLSELTVGEKVLSMNSKGELVYSPVLLFLDRNVDENRVFIKIHTKHGKQITATTSHLLLVVSATKILRTNQTLHYDDTQTTFAENVQVGDRLLVRPTNDTNVLEFDIVTNIETIYSKGVFAPLTEEGTIVVDDVVASCYAIINSQSLAQFAFAPVRFYTHLKSAWLNVMSYIGLYTEDHVMQAKSTQQGIHWYPKMLYSVANFILPKKMFIDDDYETNTI